MELAGLDPERLRPAAARSTPTRSRRRARTAPLADVLPVLRHCLGALAQDAQHVLVVCDGDGPDPLARGPPAREGGRRSSGSGSPRGCCGREDSAGTNAIGTALAIDHAVQVFSAEHFLAEQHAWWCSAAPIHDPATGALLGVVDISGPLRTAHPH